MALGIHAGGLRPLAGAIPTGPFEAASAVTFAAPAATIGLDGKITKTSGASGKCAGLLVATQEKDSALAAGEVGTLIAFGPVAGFTGLTPGRLIYLGSTAGELADSGSVAVAYALTATTAFVLIGVSSAAS